MAKKNIIEIDGQKYRRLYYNTCCRCALRTEVTGKPCPIEDCDDGIYYKEVKEVDSSKERLKEQPSLIPRLWMPMSYE